MSGWRVSVGFGSDGETAAFGPREASAPTGSLFEDKTRALVISDRQHFRDKAPEGSWSGCGSWAGRLGWAWVPGELFLFQTTDDEGWQPLGSVTFKGAVVGLEFLAACSSSWCLCVVAGTDGTLRLLRVAVAPPAKGPAIASLYDAPGAVAGLRHLAAHRHPDGRLTIALLLKDETSVLSLDGALLETEPMAALKGMSVSRSALLHPLSALLFIPATGRLLGLGQGGVSELRGKVWTPYLFHRSTLTEAWLLGQDQRWLVLRFQDGGEDFLATWDLESELVVRTQRLPEGLEDLGLVEGTGEWVYRAVLLLRDENGARLEVRSEGGEELYKLQLGGGPAVLGQCLGECEGAEQVVLGDWDSAEGAIRVRSVEQTSPQVRLDHLLRRQRWAEAEQHARFHRLSLAGLHRARLQHCLDQVAAAGPDEEPHAVQELQRQFALVSDKELKVDVALKAALVLKDAQVLHGLLSAVEENDRVRQHLHRLASHRELFGDQALGDFWALMCERPLVPVLLKLVESSSPGRTLSAFWARHRAELLGELGESKLAWQTVLLKASEQLKRTEVRAEELDWLELCLLPPLLLSVPGLGRHVLKVCEGIVLQILEPRAKPGWTALATRALAIPRAAVRSWWSSKKTETPLEVARKAYATHLLQPLAETPESAPSTDEAVAGLRAAFVRLQSLGRAVAAVEELQTYSAARLSLREVQGKGPEQLFGLMVNRLDSMEGLELFVPGKGRAFLHRHHLKLGPVLRSHIERELSEGEVKGAAQRRLVVLARHLKDFAPAFAARTLHAVALEVLFWPRSMDDEQNHLMSPPYPLSLREQLEDFGANQKAAMGLAWLDFAQAAQPLGLDVAPFRQALLPTLQAQTLSVESAGSLELNLLEHMRCSLLAKPEGLGACLSLAGQLRKAGLRVQATSEGQLRAYRLLSRLLRHGDEEGFWADLDDVPRGSDGRRILKRLLDLLCLVLEQGCDRQDLLVGVGRTMAARLGDRGKELRLSACKEAAASGDSLSLARLLTASRDELERDWGHLKAVAELLGSTPEKLHAARVAKDAKLRGKAQTEALKLTKAVHRLLTAAVEKQAPMSFPLSESVVGCSRVLCQPGVLEDAVRAEQGEDLLSAEALQQKAEALLRRHVQLLKKAVALVDHFVLGALLEQVKHLDAALDVRSGHATGDFNGLRADELGPVLGPLRAQDPEEEVRPLGPAEVSPMALVPLDSDELAKAAATKLAEQGLWERLFCLAHRKLAASGDDEGWVRCMAVAAEGLLRQLVLERSGDRRDWTLALGAALALPHKAALQLCHQLFSRVGDCEKPHSAASLLLVVTGSVLRLSGKTQVLEQLKRTTSGVLWSQRLATLGVLHPIDADVTADLGLADRFVEEGLPFVRLAEYLEAKESVGVVPALFDYLRRLLGSRGQGFERRATAAVAHVRAKFRQEMDRLWKEPPGLLDTLSPYHYAPLRLLLQLFPEIPEAESHLRLLAFLGRYERRSKPLMGERLAFSGQSGEASADVSLLDSTVDLLTPTAGGFLLDDGQSVPADRLPFHAFAFPDKHAKLRELLLKEELCLGNLELWCSLVEASEAGAALGWALEARLRSAGEDVKDLGPDLRRCFLAFPDKLVAVAVISKVFKALKSAPVKLQLIMMAVLMIDRATGEPTPDSEALNKAKARFMERGKQLGVELVLEGAGLLSDATKAFGAQYQRLIGHLYESYATAPDGRSLDELSEVVKAVAKAAMLDLDEVRSELLDDWLRDSVSSSAPDPFGPSARRVLALLHGAAELREPASRLLAAAQPLAGRSGPTGRETRSAEPLLCLLAALSPAELAQALPEVRVESVRARLQGLLYSRLLADAGLKRDALSKVLGGEGAWEGSASGERAVALLRSMSPSAAKERALHALARDHPSLA